MNFVPKGAWAHLSDADALLMDVARRVQLTRTQHETADRNFRALCEYVDREGSPLHGRVVECYPSGSFATGTAIKSRVRKNQHDVDVVIELDEETTASPRAVLEALFEAINGDPGSRYHGKVELHSRCVTVTYDDGTTVDLMPVARSPGGPDRAGNLFHFKAEAGESYHKAVNPWGFAEHFNGLVEYDPAFYEAFQGRRLLIEGDVVFKAETQPMPDHVPLEEKSPRVVSLQLIKRNRDINFRPRRTRKPPAVVLAAIALDAGPVLPSLVDETISIATAIRSAMMRKDGPRRTFQVFNPAYPIDEFTDRWPENSAAQDMFDDDLRRLIVDLRRLKNDHLSLQEKKELLERLFGETAASYAVENLLEAKQREMEAGQLHVGPSGKVLGRTAAVAAHTIVAATPRSAAARVGTREGGGKLRE